MIGGGLIGTSVIRAARANGAVREIAVADANPLHRARLAELGIADSVHADVVEAVKDADLALLAVPVMAMGEATACEKGIAAMKYAVALARSARPNQWLR